jgi:MoaA/NifB/PqqE/SkfB family radical SAM enzyme
MATLRSYLALAGGRVRSPRFNSLFLFVTSRCNSLCRTCFYFDKLNSRDDLTFDQIRRISETAPAFTKLWISGGEPFMRPELGEIITMFAANNGIRNVNLPTNGLLPGKIAAAVDRVLTHSPDVAIDLNFSFDGLANTHDAIRGVPNNFERSLASLREAADRYAGIGRVRVNVVSVITRENYEEMVQLGFYMLENSTADGHYFEAVRGQTPDPTLKNLTPDALKVLHRRLMPLQRRYAKKLFGHLPGGVRQIAEMYYLGNIRLHFDLHERCFDQPRRWPMRCTAGETTMVLDHNGRFRACELRGILGDLAEYRFDVQAALAGDAMRREVAGIAEAGCWCTHSCFIQDSSKFSPRVQLFEIPWAWWRQRKNRFDAATLDEVESYKALELS